MSEAALHEALEFGALLKDWRAHRRVSQLDLSTLSGISQRHISFLETGRSRPSRAMVLALSDSLDIPLRERNALLQSAGFAAVYPEAPLDGPRTALFQAALEATLNHHEPYPALVLDGRWNLVMANAGALRFFGQFVDIFGALETIGSPAEFQVVRLCLAEAGLKPYIANWEELVFSFLARARRALLVNPRDAFLPMLIREISEHPDAPPSWRQPDWMALPDPALAMEMEKDGVRYRLFTMLAHFGAAQNVTLEELSVETFFPADAATRAHLLALAGQTAEESATRLV
jgi:transcriptional regulator with XRE-family HTH domain